LHLTLLGAEIVAVRRIFQTIYGEGDIVPNRC